MRFQILDFRIFISITFITNITFYSQLAYFYHHIVGLNRWPITHRGKNHSFTKELSVVKYLLSIHLCEPLLRKSRVRCKFLMAGSLGRLQLWVLRYLHFNYKIPVMFWNAGIFSLVYWLPFLIFFHFIFLTFHSYNKQYYTF